MTAVDLAGAGTEPTAARVFARNARSFHWASRILSAGSGDAVARLYAFCRHVDDVADELPAEQARPALLDLREQVLGANPAPPLALDFRRLAAEHDLDPRGVPHLFDGLLGDLEPVRLGTADDVVRYGYRVAGVVGLWMARLLGARSERSLPFAVDLGIAMQLTNIARDVAEDAGRGRVYLPARWLDGGLSPAAILAPTEGQRATLHAARIRLLDLAEDYYRSAERGLAFLPLRARLCILTAARVYRAIGQRIRRAGPGSLETRAVVGTPGKLAHTAGALLGLPLLSIPGRPHDPALHAPLGDWPGVDRGAAAGGARGGAR